MLLVAQTACVGMHALEMYWLRFLVFQEGWGAHTLVGALICPVSLEYIGVTALDTITSSLVHLIFYIGI